jgi:transposase
VVVNTTQFKVIRQSVKKTDPHDARALALYLSKNMLPEVRMKDKEHGQLASLTQTRDTLVKLRTALKNKVNNILSARGVNLAKEALGSEKALNEVQGLPFDEIVRTELRVIVEQIRSLNKSIAELEKTIGEEGSKLEGHKSLSSIKGIGKITGAILLSVIGDVNDFADEGRLASYFGIVPRVSNSNETERSGRIHKRGTKLGRTALVQSALIAANYSPYLKRFYEQVKARRGAGKAIIALARKFLGIIYRTLKNKWVFEDSRTSFWRRPHEDALGPTNGNPGFWLPLRRPSVLLDSRTVLGRKGSLRRGKPRRALASCAPFCNANQSRRAAPTETRSRAVSSSCERREPDRS